MNILHYSLGLPPYRSGGLTKYSIDLMEKQAERENIFLLFPGKLNLFKREVKIKKYKLYKNIKTFEVVNPQGIPLIGGISNIKYYTKNTDIEIFRKFLTENKIEVLHIHTLMGLYKELLEAAKLLNIKILYTTHDYYGLAPNPNFLAVNNEIKIGRNFKDFNELNIDCSSYKKMYILQSRIYRFLKDKDVISKIKKMKGRFKNNNIEELHSKTNFIEKEYKILKKYFDNLLDLIDIYLFNSSVTEEIFREFLEGIEGQVLSISHSNIKDNREKKFFGETLKISYMGPFKTYKGFGELLQIAEDFRELDIKFSFYGDYYSGDTTNLENCCFKGKYNYNDLNKIMRETDLLVVPSVWKETFGFIAAEASSYGVPCLVTENVGAKDVVSGIVSNDIKREILRIFKNRKILEEINEINLNSDFNMDFNEHVSKVLKLYK